LRKSPDSAYLSTQLLSRVSAAYRLAQVWLTYPINTPA
jgi:hypothetical protein